MMVFRSRLRLFFACAALCALALCRARRWPDAPQRRRRRRRLIRRCSSAYRWRSIGPNRGGRSIAVVGREGPARARPTSARSAAGCGRRPTPATTGRRSPTARSPARRSAPSRSRSRIPTSSTSAWASRASAATSCRATASTSRSTPARRGRTSASGTPTPSRRSASTRPTPTSSTSPASASTTARATSAACSRAPTAARPGSARCSRTTRPAPSTSSIDANNPNVLYAALWEAYRIEYQMSSGGPGSGLYKSTDGGETWTEITRNPGMPAGMVGRIGVANTRADSNRVYALVENENGGLFVSDDAGATWKLMNASRSIRQRAFYYTHVFGDPEQQGRRLHAEHVAVPLDRRRQDAGAGRPEHARRPPRPVDRSRRRRTT